MLWIPVFYPYFYYDYGLYPGVSGAIIEILCRMTVLDYEPMMLAVPM